MIGAVIVTLLLEIFGETEIVLLSGICLVVLTIGIRWFLRKYELSGEKAKIKR